MKCRHLIILALAVLLLSLAVPAALAAPSAAGCPKSESGTHNWKPRPQSPWCERPGGIVYVCTYCGKKVLEESTPALGHLWGPWTVTKAASCSAEGSRTRTCSRCEKVETQSIPTAGHAYSAWAMTVPPTCEEEGEQAHVCASCGRMETKPVAPLGHDWDEGMITKKPTATEDGVMTFTCKNDPGHTRTEAIPATGGTEAAEGHPSLFISLACDGHIHETGSNSIDWEHFLLVYVTVTNTGNIPLKINLPYNKEHVLQPDETFTYKEEVRVIWSTPDAGFHDDINYTSDDPLYYGYVTVTETADGYDPDGIVEEPLCTSNEASLTVSFPREDAPEETAPAISLIKAASKPEDGDYFKQGEQIHWILTATNTSEDPVTDVTVTDKGETVGSFDSIGPDESQPCSVPDHTVTEYEAKVVGYVKNAAVAKGRDAEGNEHSWPSNEATALTKKPLDKGEDPLGPVYGLNVGVSLTKAEVPGPANGEYYQLNETIHYVITVKNTGKEELKDLSVTDSLAGFATIGTLSSLAPGAEKAFNFSYTVQESDVGHPFVVNSAILTYAFGDGISGTPRISTVYSKLNGANPPGFDPDLLPRGSDYCSMTLDTLGDTEARYTLHTCTEHLPAAQAAEAAAQAGDWDKAVEIWRGEIEKQYAVLYAAGDSEARSAVMEEKALFDAFIAKYADAVNTEDAARMRADTDRTYDMLLAAATGTRREALLTEREQLYAAIEAFGSTTKCAALAEILRLRCAFLCCAIHTMPEDLPGSITGQHTALDAAETHETNGREISGLEGSDSTVVERYDETGAAALKETVRMAVSAGNRAVAFSHASVVWQMALDDIMTPLYEAAAEERKQAIAAWRLTLDSLQPAERRLLTMMYSSNRAMLEEQLMNLYKDAVLCTEKIR